MGQCHRYYILQNGRVKRNKLNKFYGAIGTYYQQIGSRKKAATENIRADYSSRGGSKMSSDPPTPKVSIPIRFLTPFSDKYFVGPSLASKLGWDHFVSSPV